LLIFHSAFDLFRGAKKKMKFLILFAFVALAACDYPLRRDWQEIRPALEAEELQNVMLKLSGRMPLKYPMEKRDPGRIVNGEGLKLG
jgi:hypothetical protein